MAKKEYAHLVKPLRVQEPPKGLYGGARVWMEGKDLEGFNAHFTYGFIKEPGPFHPLEGALVHPYDECLIFAGLDNTNIHFLGAEMSICLGDEREEHVFSEPTVVVIPKGTPHGPVLAKRVDKPFVHYGFGLAPEYKATSLPVKAKGTGSTYAHLVKRLVTHVDPNKVGTGMGYERVVDKDGVCAPQTVASDPETPTSSYGCSVVTSKGWKSTSRGASTAGAANGTGRERHTPTPRRRYSLSPVSIRTISTISGRRSRWGWGRKARIQQADRVHLPQKDFPICRK